MRFPIDDALSQRAVALLVAAGRDAIGDNGAMCICKDRDLRMNLVRIPLSR